MTVGAKLQIKSGDTVAVVDGPEGVSLELPAGTELTDEAGCDALAWVAYPKGGRLGTDLNRDSLWELLATQGIRPVRQVSIDATSSAVRFRPG